MEREEGIMKGHKVLRLGSSLPFLSCRVVTLGPIYHTFHLMFDPEEMEGVTGTHVPIG